MEVPPSKGLPIISIGHRTWRFFSSVRLAVVLILILVGLSLIGTLVYDIFHSFWFLVPGSLLIINILVCSISRWGKIQLSTALSHTQREESFYQTKNSQLLEITGFNPEKMEHLLTRIFAKRRYKVHIDRDTGEGNRYLLAEKNRWSPWSTYLIHLSLILFIIGYLWGAYWGFKDNTFTIPTGATREIGHNTGLSIQLVSFKDEYWPDGSPKDYLSTVNILKNNQVVKSGPVRVNHPLSYQGIRIFQSYFGPSVQIRISDIEGKVLSLRNIALDRMLSDEAYPRPMGFFRLFKEGYIVYLVSPAPEQDPVLSDNQLGLEIYLASSNARFTSQILDKDIPATIENLQITYLNQGQFSGFQVSRDPGNSLIWIASGLFLSGLIIAFYFPHRRIWALMQSDGLQKTWVRIRPGTGLHPGNITEIKSIVKDIADQKNQRFMKET